jgi:hypothetical protein
MIEYAKVILWGVSYWKALFKKELIKIVTWTENEELIELKNWCHDTFHEMHPEVLAEVFSGKEEILKPIRIQVQTREQSVL